MKYIQSDFITDAVLTCKDLSNTDKLVFIYWLIQAPDYHLSSYQIAKNLSKDRRTIRRSIDKIKELKFWRERPLRGKHGRLAYDLTPEFAHYVQTHVREKYGRHVVFALTKQRRSK